jgi:hypothetical protein
MGFCVDVCFASPWDYGSHKPLIWTSCWYHPIHLWLLHSWAILFTIKFIYHLFIDHIFSSVSCDTFTGLPVCFHLSICSYLYIFFFHPFLLSFWIIYPLLNPYYPGTTLSYLLSFYHNFETVYFVPYFSDIFLFKLTISHSVVFFKLLLVLNFQIFIF